jgi:predicted GIY-YIG superfamily endonuclease
MSVYLLHFSRPHHHARHYLGYAENVPRRVRQHRAGQASPLTAAAVDSGITLCVARVWWNGDRALERRLKDRHEAPRLCPLCCKARRKP